MLKKIVFILILTCAFNVSASEKISTQIILEKFLADTNRFSARFQQKLVDKYGYLLQQSAGSLHMQRPGKFRWDYIIPYPQSIISNSKKIWMYDSELEQVNVRAYDQISASSPINLLDKNQKLDIDFTVEEMADKNSQQWLKLTPKNAASDFKEMQVGLLNGQIKTMIFEDAFEQHTEISFEQLVINPDFDENYFEFIAPDGTDVMGDF